MNVAVAVQSLELAFEMQISGDTSRLKKFRRNMWAVYPVIMWNQILFWRPGGFLDTWTYRV